MPLISVTANSIDAAGLKLEVELPVAWLDDELSDADATATAPGHLSARLSSAGNAVVVRGRVRATLTVPCARCTRPAPVAVNTEMSLLLTPVVAAKPAKAGDAAKHVVHVGHAAPAAETARPAKRKDDEEYEFTAEEADTDTFDGETVELDAFVREAILLEVPNFPLCSEDCPGIGPAAQPAPEPGDTLDPRLAPLAALRAKLASQTKKNKE